MPTTIQVLEGEGIIHIDSEQIPVSKGGLVSLRAGAAHEVLPKQGSNMLPLVHYLRSGGPLAVHSAKKH